NPKTLSHVRKYVSDVMIETDLESMGIDLSLAAAPAPAETKAAQVKAAPAKPAPAPAPKPAPVKAEEVKPEPPVEESVKPAEEVTAPPAEPSRPEKSALATGAADQLTDEEIEALKELVSIFRVIRNFFTGISQLASGKPPGS
ncbi:MAG: hypothetical protein ACLQPD_08575, partial [Desulfomonilaceae bacterium]